MPTLQLHRLAGHLILNDHARRQLLSADRRALLDQFELTSEEQEAIEQARPATLPEALAVLEILAGHDQPHSGQASTTQRSFIPYSSSLTP
jgi:hypothetical protein